MLPDPEPEVLPPTMIQRLPCITLLLCLGLTAARTAGAQPPGPPANGLVRVFLDCNRCDDSYVKREVTFVDYVRNREDADVHVLVTTQSTGGGGTQWTLKFIGLGRYQGSDETLIYDSPQTATSDEVRAGFVETFKLGLVRYVTNSSIADRLGVVFRKPDSGTAPPSPETDPWNFWVFRLRGNGDVNGEESSKGKSIRGSFSATRTTDAWRVSLNTNANYRDTTYQLDDNGVETTFVSVSRNLDASGIVVKSLTPHWSVGIVGSANSQTFRNFHLRTRIAPGIEYNFFPYSESSRRMLTVQYTVGYDRHRYREVTIYDKLRENLVDHRAEIGLGMRQPWGTARAEFNFSQYLTDPSKYSLGLDGYTNVRLFKGFSVEFSGDFSRTRDQIYLPRGEASTEDILLRQRQLATGYEYSFNFGFSYSFGSIFNNIVNPRFGGGGGF